MSQITERGILVALAGVLSLSTFGVSQEKPIDENQKRPVGVRVLKHDGGVPLFKAWLEEDVVWIIAEEERAAFKSLKNDEERDRFVEAFWERRDPTPDTFENEYKVEHYHRIAFANANFSARVPGWRTDRGRIYIMYGAPDKIESYPVGRTNDKTPEGEQSSPYPIEVWRYHYLEGVGKDVVINFVDACGCGEYQMSAPPELKNAILSSPAGLTGAHESRVEPGDPRVFLHPAVVPSIRFKDLEALLNSQPPPTSIPFDVKADFEKVTSVTFLVPMTIAVRNRDVTFIEESGVRIGKLNVLGRYTTLTGHVVDVFEDSIVITAPKESGASAPDVVTYLKKMFALRCGRYGLQIAIKDANGGQAGTWLRSVVVTEP